MARRFFACMAGSIPIPVSRTVKADVLAWVHATHAARPAEASRIPLRGFDLQLASPGIASPERSAPN